MKRTTIILLIMLITVSFTFAHKSESNDLKKEFLKAIIHTNAELLANSAAVLKNKNINIKDYIRQSLKGIRFFNNQSGYLMVYDFKGICIAHGTRPEIEGLDRINHKDSKGTFNIKIMSEKAKTKGAGYIEYYYINPSTKKEEKKIAYFERIRGTEFWIAAGFYVK